MKTTRKGEKKLRNIVNALRIGVPTAALALVGAGCDGDSVLPRPVGIEPAVGRMPAAAHHSQTNGCGNPDIPRPVGIEPAPARKTLPPPPPPQRTAGIPPPPKAE